MKRLNHTSLRSTCFRMVAGGLWLASILPVVGETNAPIGWPPAPAAARVVFVREISSPASIGVRPSFFRRLGDALTGVSADEKTLVRPFALALDAEENLILTDTAANLVASLDFKRKQWREWRSVNGRPLQSPVAAARAGKVLFVIEAGRSAVMALDENGRSLFSLTNGFLRPVGLALAGERLVIADAAAHQITVCDLTGKILQRFGQRGKGPGEFNFPTHVATDTTGKIYVTDSLNYRVQVFSADGSFIRAFGQLGDGPGSFSRPKGVAVDSAGHVYVVDAEFSNVQLFDAAGRVLLPVGEPGQVAGRFWLPNGIAINSHDEIFVADAYNHRVQQFRYLREP